MNPDGGEKAGPYLLLGTFFSVLLVGVYGAGTVPEAPAPEVAPAPVALDEAARTARVMDVLAQWGRAGDASASVPVGLPASPSAPAGPVRLVLTSGSGAQPADVRGDALRQVVRDLTAITVFRPAFSFWQNVFMVPDGSIVFGDAADGHLVATVPERGPWRSSPNSWADEPLARVLDAEALPSNPTQRRDRLTALLEPVAGPLVSNPTRGALTLRSYPVYGGFLADWGEIYEHFGVPAEIGLAQAMIESGWGPRVRSEARAIGFCQWLEPNWNRLKRVAHAVIEAYNQTTQAAYCAAYLRILATKYGSFLPALSEHHAGGANVGRTMINGSRLGGQDTREQYLLGAQFARDIREISFARFEDVVETYGPRSFLYTEMVFGNAASVARLRREAPQEAIYAMRVRRPLTVQEISRTTGLTREEIQRFNPALVQQVPIRATLYLPFLVEDFGPDVTFWRSEMDPEYAQVLRDFVGLGDRSEPWDDPSFELLLQEYQKRFQATNTEQGYVMAAVLTYTIQETYSSRRGAILDEFRTSDRIRLLFEEAQGARELRVTEE